MKDIYTKDWIVEHAREILQEYPEGITVRQLHYRLVTIGMTNDMNHYKRVVSAMTDARWDADISMDAFIDRERSVYGRTESNEKVLEDEIESTKETIKYCMTSYSLERWSNQPKYVEVWIEKKALQGVFEGPCGNYDVALCPCKGYPSITYIHKAAERFKDEMGKGKEIVILYAGDHDPSGDDIPRSLQQNLERMGCEITVQRIALTPEQIRTMRLPGVPPKHADTRTSSWTGHTVVELDAIEPNTLKNICKEQSKSILTLNFMNSLKKKKIVKGKNTRMH